LELLGLFSPFSRGFGGIINWFGNNFHKKVFRMEIFSLRDFQGKGKGNFIGKPKGKGFSIWEFKVSTWF